MGDYECPKCGQMVKDGVWGIKTYAMFERHIAKMEGRTVDELIEYWIAFNKETHFGKRHGTKFDIGKASLCPVEIYISFPNGVEDKVKEVGDWVWVRDYDKYSEEDLERYRAALKADEDVVRLLKERED